MCGINLVIDRSGKVGLDSLKNMMDKIRHRGPDSSHFRIIRKPELQILFGTNRLRVVDQDEASDQPFFEKNEDHFLMYNGEMYNQEEIRNPLIRQGIRFQTSSDTEVLFHFLKNHGAEDISQINGMYAFAFIDLEEDSLTLARDPWGMKPLYYYLDDRYFIISSEIKGIISSGLISMELNADQVPYYLRYRYTQPPFTLLKNIFQFEKGSVYRFDLKNFRLKKQSTFLLTDKKRFEIKEKDIPGQIEHLLVDSLFSHSQSIRPAGIFLSGGVDSTLLLALSSFYNISIPYVFSIVNQPQDRKFGTEDYKYVKLAVQQYHPSSEIVELDESIMDELENFIERMDHPVADPAYLLTYKLSGIASQKTNVVLSGAGADELFAGYNRHYAFYRYLRNYKRIKNGFPVIKKLKSFIPTMFPFYGRKRIVLLKKLLSKIEKDPWLTFDNFLSFEKLNPPLIQGEWEENRSGDLLSRQLLSAIERDRQEYLPEDVLTVNDRACMLESLEMRMPYLDYRITSFVRQIPSRMLISKGQKWILKDLLKKYGGDKFGQRPKEGFGFPFGQWIRKPTYRNILDKLTLENNLIFNFIERNKFLKLIHNHHTGKEDYSHEIWSLLILSFWIEKNFN